MYSYTELLKHGLSYTFQGEKIKCIRAARLKYTANRKMHASPSTSSNKVTEHSDITNSIMFNRRSMASLFHRIDSVISINQYIVSIIRIYNIIK